MKLGLKLWSNNVAYLKDAEKLVSEKQCDYIELYAFPDSFEQLASVWAAIDTPYVIHAPHFVHGMCLSDPESSSLNTKRAHEAFAYADRLSAQYVIFHPGVGGRDEETIKQLNAWPESWKQRILIENKPYRTITTPPEVCNGNSPESMKKILEETGLKFCYDIGHGICSSNSRKTDPFEEIVQYQNLNPKMYHISDGESDSELDSHLHLGEGNYDFSRIMESVDFSIPISIETEKRSKEHLNDFRQDIRYLRNELYNYRILPAGQENVQDVFDIANDPEVRKHSIHSDPIDWAVHQQWYARALENKKMYFWLVRDLVGRIAGYVRYEWEEQSQAWVCSIAISSKVRSAGLGTWALQKSLKMLRRHQSQQILAWIKTTNQRSMKAFCNAGFIPHGECVKDDVNYGIFKIN